MVSFPFLNWNTVQWYEMPPYGEDDDKERRNKLTAFLDEMGW